MKILKHIISSLVWAFVGLYAVAMTAIHIPSVQQRIAREVARLVSTTLGTQVTVGRVDLGFLNRLIIDDVTILDQHDKPLLSVSRLTAKIDPAPLATGRIVISSAQVFGAALNLYKATAYSEANFQFALDSLASKDTTQQTPLNLTVNSFIMRRGTVTYHQLDAPQTPGLLNPRHLHMADISAHILLKTLRDDSLNVNVKRLSCREGAGLNIDKLAFKLTAGNHAAQLRDFTLLLPHSTLAIDSLTATYDHRRFKETLRAKGRISRSLMAPRDLACLYQPLARYPHAIALNADVSYRDATLNASHLQVSSEGGDLALTADGSLRLHDYGRPAWLLHARQLTVTSEAMGFVNSHVAPLPAEVLRLGDVAVKGRFSGDAEGTLTTDASVTTDIGNAEIKLQAKADKHLTANIITDGIDIRKLTDNNQLGLLAANLNASGKIGHEMTVSGEVSRIDYDGNSYQGITLDGRYVAHRLTGWLQIADPKVTARLETAIEGTTLNDVVGVVSLHGLSLPEHDYHLDFLRVESGFEEGQHVVKLNSDFAHARLSGTFDYATLAQGVANVIGSRLPTLPGMPPLTKPTTNDFALQLSVGKTDWLQKLLAIDLDLQAPVVLDATVNDASRQLMLNLRAPAFSYKGKRYSGGDVHISSPRDTLLLTAAIRSGADSATPTDLTFRGNAADNHLTLALEWDNNDSGRHISGVVNADATLYTNADGQSEAHVSILPSNVFIEQSTWEIEPSDILYTTDRLLVDHFSIHNGDQYIRADGVASSRNDDQLFIDLNDVEVAYVLDLVDFDAVSFSGLASGRATLSSAFDNPDAQTALTVRDFKFQEGRMGTLNALVAWNKQQKQIDIQATANDGPEALTLISGYVSPEREYIDLDIKGRGTYLDFMHSFTESFISNITGHAYGDLRLAGPLDAINLTGGLRVNGQATIAPLNTTYQLPGDTITFVYNEILLDSLPIHDRLGNTAYLSGAVHHRDLTNLSLDLHVDTDQLLGYDFHDFGDQSFYGTVIAAGTVDIAMKGDDVNINCNVTPLKNSVFVYNAANPDAVSNQEFITFKTQQPTPYPSQREGSLDTSTRIIHQQSKQAPLPLGGAGGGFSGGGSNIYLNFLVNVTPDGTLRLLMDDKTGDYITLNGSGTLQASYYNKGTLQMQGTYTVSSGTYDITIQQIINKKFLFQPGGTIVFTGDPYDAALNLQALYTVNGVSLSDLQLGNSFSSNTVRVNCLMNIGGQPSAPQVTFDLDLPTVNADEKQMVRSLLASQQEMNQQVLYLLGIGRFYSQGQNNASQQQQDQTSLAMQSFLSGTLSTQINNVINQFVKNDNWNFGANISTGTEGWNNAEYEGIVAGRMLNNRLLINGQFGYRDNATQATPSFIGDFDINYLLLPSGNLALKVYNQTNDRYFTRSSLNTQGLGIIMKKDFNGLGDLFGRKKLVRGEKQEVKEEKQEVKGEK